MNDDKITLKNSNFYIYFALFFIIILYLFSSIKPNFADDVTLFKPALLDTDIFHWLIERYKTWSSRTIIEFIILIIINIHPAVWRFLTSIFISLIASGIILIPFDKKNLNYSFVCFSLLFLFPISMINDIGYIATTGNYLWPFTFSIPYFFVLKNIIANQNENNRFFNIFSLICLVVACNQEQTCPIIFCSSLLCFLYKFYTKDSFHNTKKYLIISFFISAISMLYITLCPGNKLRIWGDTVISFSDFHEISFIKKILMGFLSTMSYFYGFCKLYERGHDFISPNFVFIILYTFILINSVLKKNYKLVSLQIPGLIITTFYFVISYLKLTNVPHILLLLRNNTLPTYTDFSEFLVCIEIFIYCILFIALLYSFYKSFSDSKKAIIVILVFLAGFSSRMLLSFSPTVYVSFSRPCFIFTVSIYFIYSFLFNEIINTNKVSIITCTISLLFFSVILFLLRSIPIV